jgi:hypothetical protein
VTTIRVTLLGIQRGYVVIGIETEDLTQMVPLYFEETLEIRQHSEEVSCDSPQKMPIALNLGR